MERECRENAARRRAPPLLVAALLICALAAVAVNVNNNCSADARVFPPKRYPLSPGTKYRDGDGGGGGGGGVGSFPVPRRYSCDNG